MIVQVRVDDRLIHGQVALVWTKELNTTRIIVANKHAVESDALRMTLSMGTPAGQKLLVKDIPDAPTAYATCWSWSRAPRARSRA